jgi:hypothetical protein
MTDLPLVAADWYERYENVRNQKERKYVTSFNRIPIKHALQLYSAEVDIYCYNYLTSQVMKTSSSLHRNEIQCIWAADVPDWFSFIHLNKACQNHKRSILTFLFSWANTQNTLLYMCSSTNLTMNISIIQVYGKKYNYLLAELIQEPRRRYGKTSIMNDDR